VSESDEVVILFRPVGQQELDLIHEKGNRSFPARLPEQPIFYPVLNEEYAVHIARDWNARYNEPKCGYVTRFRVRRAFLEQYEPKIAGSQVHQEYWIPAGDLEQLNHNIISATEVIAEFTN
jgi:hypothetical protein